MKIKELNSSLSDIHYQPLLQKRFRLEKAKLLAVSLLPSSEKVKIHSLYALIFLLIKQVAYYVN